MLALSATCYNHLLSLTFPTTPTISLSPPSQGFSAKNFPTQVWLAFFAPQCIPVLLLVLMCILLNCLSLSK